MHTHRTAHPIRNGRNYALELEACTYRFSNALQGGKLRRIIMGRIISVMQDEEFASPNCNVVKNMALVRPPVHLERLACWRKDKDAATTVSISKVFSVFFNQVKPPIMMRKANRPIKFAGDCAAMSTIEG